PFCAKAGEPTWLAVRTIPANNAKRLLIIDSPSRIGRRLQWPRRINALGSVPLCGGFRHYYFGQLQASFFASPPSGPSIEHIRPVLIFSRALFCPPMVISVREPEISDLNSLPSSSFRAILARPSHSATA